MKTWLKKYKLDIIIVAVLLIASILVSLIFLTSQKHNNLSATIYHHDEIVEVIDLEKEDELREFSIQGDHGALIIEVKHDAIRVKESNCPHQDCVNVGWVSSTNRPIVCVYNGITITIEGASSSNDWEV